MTELARRGIRRGGKRIYRFSILVPGRALSPEVKIRRGLTRAAIKAVVLKVAGKIADFALSKLALLGETATWKLKNNEKRWLSKP
ncbi:MAG: hypothetical protein IPO99_19485 [Nitrospira sp.]|nr:hypothetical protein [Nitrospira sp.]